MRFSRISVLFVDSLQYFYETGAVVAVAVALVTGAAAGTAGTLTTVALTAGALPGLAGTAGAVGTPTGAAGVLEFVAAAGIAGGAADVTAGLTGVLLLLVEVMFPILLLMVPILGSMVALVEVTLSEAAMGFRFPSTCSPTSRLDSPASFTIKIRPLGADSSSCSNLASNVIAVLPLVAGAGGLGVGAALLAETAGEAVAGGAEFATGAGVVTEGAIFTIGAGVGIAGACRFFLLKNSGIFCGICIRSSLSLKFPMTLSESGIALSFLNAVTRSAETNSLDDSSASSDD